MGKKANHMNGRELFAPSERLIERRLRRQRALFIPRLLTKSTEAEARLANPDREKAFQVVQHWAGHERSGWLYQQNETSIDTQFLDDLFGKGLGYQVKSANPENYQLAHKFTVPDVGIADGALGEFPAAASPTAVIELKDANTDLDRDRSNGRTAVQQCWDYLNAQPQCLWGIVSNFATIRLYHRERGTLAYEEFTLQELTRPEKFHEFYYIFERGGLLRSVYSQKPRALDLLQRTQQRQREVGDELYRSYQLQRLRLIENLMQEHGKNFDAAVHVAQKLLDRVVFIAFCEDRDLLKPNCLDRAWREVAPFSRATNPRWQNFLQLFTAVDRGGKAGKEAGVEFGYNGSLFKPDPEIDTLDLDDDWTGGFRELGNYDFSEEVNVEVLGNLFERSITELEKLRVGGLFALKAGIEGTPQPKPRGRKGKTAPVSRMPKSAQRKRFGIYYTPPAFTALLVERTVDAVVTERFAALRGKLKVDPEARETQEPARLLKYWRACLEELKSITVCDPACGSGAFLIQAYEVLDGHYKTVMHGLAGAGMARDAVRELEDSIPDLILEHNLYGVDLSEQGVEITQLALWIRSARKDKKLSDLSKHIIWGNSLVSDPAVDAKALDWNKAFPQVFGKDGPGGFTCVIGNPPWERVKVQDREFFSLTDPDTAEAVSAAVRKKRIENMPAENPELHKSYVAARERAQKVLDYARESSRYPLTGKGDVNLYMLFAELASSIVAPNGLAGILVPSGIATDDTTKEFFAGLMDSSRLASLYDFENRNKAFEDVDGRFKFSALVFGGSKRQFERADFVFFAHDVEETAAHYKQRHIPLSGADMKLLNPNTRTCPIFRTRRDAELTKAVYNRVPILIDHNRKQGGNPWNIKFFTMFHQTNDAGHFAEAKSWLKKGYALQGNVFVKGSKRALPLYEAKMVQAFDHRAASVVVDEENWVRQGQKTESSPVEHQNPEFCVQPRWWVAEKTVDEALEEQPGSKKWLLGFKDITSPTNERTMISAFIPRAAATNKFVLALTETCPHLQPCLLGNLNSYAFDYITRQKIGGITLNFFIVEQLPTLPPETYAEPCPWDKKQTLEAWISERVLKLTCTADDMIPLAQACNFIGSRGDGVHLWKESERAQLRAELDAAYFILYGIERPDVEYILSTFSNTGLAEKSAGQKFLYEPGLPGAMILEAYDRLR
ncbi:MAG: N-6 DNA methylase [Planctomycetes bacterium]|nr:N-6 DNA methylase [Planctomycetota bacterium]